MAVRIWTSNHPPLCFCTAWMTRASTQDWFTVRFVSANFHQQLLSFSLVHSPFAWLEYLR